MTDVATRAGSTRPFNAGLAARAAEEARAWDRPDLATRITASSGDRDLGLCTVLVVGPPGSGKSTAIDALLDVRACAGDLREPTATPVRVRWGDVPSATVPGLGPVPPRAVAHLAGRTATGSDDIVVALPRRLLAEGLELVDTPGLSGGIESARAAAVLVAATGAAALLYVVDPSRELSHADAELLRCATEVCPETVVLLTKVDAYREWRRLRDIDEAHLRTLGLQVPVLALSAPLRFAGLRRGDATLLEESGYPWLVHHLRTRVLARAADFRRDREVRQVRSVLSELVGHATGRRHEVASGTPRIDADALAAARAEAARLQSAAAQWQRVLSDRVSELVADTDVDLTMRVRAIRKAATDRLEEADPATAWRSFEPWLYQRTNEEVLAHFARLREAAVKVARDVADGFGDEAEDLQQTLDASIVAPRADPAATVTAPGRSGRGETSLHAARGASLGASMTLGIGHGAGLLGLTVLSGGWALPATAALAAVLLGRRMLRSAKDAQLRTRRLDANGAVTTYLDETEVRTRAESRAAVRRVHQQVRDHFTQAAAALHQTATQRLRDVEQAVRADERERSEQLQELDAALRRLRPLLAEVDAIEAGA